MIQVDKVFNEVQLVLCMLLQVYDELLFEIVFGECEWVEVLVCDKMGGVYLFDVLLEVLVGYGCSWDVVVY